MVRREYRTKKWSGLKLVTMALVFLVIAGVLFIKYQTKTSAKSLNGSVVLATGTSSSNIINATTSAKQSRYREKGGIFEVNYPKNIFKKIETDTAYPPDFKDKIKSETLVHYFQDPSCGSSKQKGPCSATSTDISISFTVVGQPFGDIYNSLLKVYSLKNLAIISLAGHQGVSFTIPTRGLGGEGMIYRVVPVDEGRTLFVARHYLDERAEARYKNVKGFIDFETQKKLFDGIMASFDFQYSI